jgi:predicted AAA+ superfamily ATPase
MYFRRKIQDDVFTGLLNNPVTAIIGPRQVGKTSLAKHILKNLKTDSIYLDLERPSDLLKLENAEWYLGQQKGKLICLDEIQRKEELFPLIRSLVDEWGGNGHFLILGSASRQMIKQSSESLAGRITYKEMSPFLLSELDSKNLVEDYLVKGGFPRSLLAEDNTSSLLWREDFITTFLERDLLFWSGFSTQTMRRLWQMLAFVNSQIVNYEVFSKSLGVSPVTVKNYIDLLASTYMLSMLPPYTGNTRKRLVKRPKVYLNDTGIVHALLGIADFNQLVGSTAMGGSWETMVLMNLKGHFPKADFSFYRTSHGAEMDIVMHYMNKVYAIECKVNQQPKLTRGAWNAIEDIKPDYTFIVAPVKESWSVKEGVDVVTMDDLVERVQIT